VLDYAGYLLTLEAIVRRCLRRSAARGNHWKVRIYDSRGNVLSTIEIEGADEGD
jgi:hypothetical protein